MGIYSNVGVSMTFKDFKQMVRKFKDSEFMKAYLNYATIYHYYNNNSFNDPRTAIIFNDVKWYGSEVDEFTDYLKTINSVEYIISPDSIEELYHGNVDEIYNPFHVDLVFDP